MNKRVNFGLNIDKQKSKQRFVLTLIVSLVVFVFIVIAIGLAIAIVMTLFKLGVIESVDGEPSLVNAVLLMAATSVIMGFLITMGASQLFLRPFNHLGDQLGRLAKGDFKAKLDFGKPYSHYLIMRKIEESFNTAAKELGQTQMLRSDFINNFSHEFKTPIVSIAGFAKLIRRGNLTPEQQDEYLSIIEVESLRLSSMATNMLNLTKVENQTILTDVSEFNLSEQLRSAVLLLADKWTQKELVLDIEFGEHLISANEELLKQTWINLVDNAVKFSNHGGTLCIRINEENDMLCVSISNEGKEITKENLDRIFNKFYQEDESHSSEGNGIGLAIVKKVVELHKGEIFVTSENAVTTFTVCLPKKKYRFSRA